MIPVTFALACSTESSPQPYDPDETFSAWCEQLAYCLDDADPVGICVEEYTSRYAQWHEDYLSGDSLARCAQATLAWHGKAAESLECSDYHIEVLYHGGPLHFMPDIPYNKACNPRIEHECREGLPCFRTDQQACGLSVEGEPAVLDCHYEGQWQLSPLLETCVDECSNHQIVDSEEIWHPHCPKGTREKSFEECKLICEEWNSIDPGESNCAAVESADMCPKDQCLAPPNCHCYCP